KQASSPRRSRSWPTYLPNLRGSKSGCALHVARDALSGIVRDFKGHVRDPTAALEDTSHRVSNQIALNCCELMWSSTAPKLIHAIHVFFHLPSSELKVLPGDLIQPLADGGG